MAKFVQAVSLGFDALTTHSPQRGMTVPEGCPGPSVSSRTHLARRPAAQTMVSEATAAFRVDGR